MTWSLAHTRRGWRYHVSDSERVFRMIYLTRRWTRALVGESSRRRRWRPPRVAVNSCRAAPQKMPFSGETMNILIWERAPFQSKLSFLDCRTNILPVQMSRRTRDDEGASDKCGRRRRERERKRGRRRAGRKRANLRKWRPHIVRHEVPTDIHRHVYRKCNYSLKGSSILSDPSRSKWVLH